MSEEATTIYKEALEDIAKGMAPPEVMHYLELESPEQFRGRMWGWSEKRASEALAAVNGMEPSDGA